MKRGVKVRVTRKKGPKVRRIRVCVGDAFESPGRFRSRLVVVEVETAKKDAKAKARMMNGRICTVLVRSLQDRWSRLGTVATRAAQQRAEREYRLREDFNKSRRRKRS